MTKRPRKPKRKKNDLVPVLIRLKGTMAGTMARLGSCDQVDMEYERKSEPFPFSNAQKFDNPFPSPSFSFDFPLFCTTSLSFSSPPYIFLFCLFTFLLLLLLLRSFGPFSASCSFCKPYYQNKNKMKPTKESKIKKKKGKGTRRAWQTFQSNGNSSDEPITFFVYCFSPDGREVQCYSMPCLCRKEIE